MSVPLPYAEGRRVDPARGACPASAGASACRRVQRKKFSPRAPRLGGEKILHCRDAADAERNVSASSTSLRFMRAVKSMMHGVLFHSPHLRIRRRPHGCVDARGLLFGAERRRQPGAHGLGGDCLRHGARNVAYLGERRVE